MSIYFWRPVHKVTNAIISFNFTERADKNIVMRMFEALSYTG